MFLQAAVALSTTCVPILSAPWLQAISHCQPPRRQQATSSMKVISAPGRELQFEPLSSNTVLNLNNPSWQRACKVSLLKFNYKNLLQNISIFLAGPQTTYAHSEHHEAQQRQRCEKELQETLSGQSLLYELELHFSSNPHPWSLCQSCTAALPPPTQVFCQSLTHSSELPQYYSPAWQS